MPSFADPFVGNVPRQITNQELAQAIRLDIASELEAIFLYDAHAAATTDPLAKKVLTDIRDEEVAHIGELMTLLQHLDPSVAEHLASGESEVKEMMEELGIAVPQKAAAETGSFAANTTATVGSLLDK